MTTQVVDLGYRPRAWQADFHRNRKHRSVIVIHTRAGKTVASLMEILDEALRCKRPNPQYAYIAPLKNQAKRNMWQYVKDYGLKIPMASTREDDLVLNLPNGAKVFVFGADDPDALRGMYLDGCVMDEPAQMKRELWYEVIVPRLADRDGWAIFTGTPKGVNLLHELYTKAQRDTTGKWYCNLLRWQDTGVFSDEKIAEMKEDMGEAKFKQEMECDFTVAAEHAIIGWDLVMPAIGKHVRDDAYSWAPKVLGVDVAFSEVGDRSLIFPRQGLVAFPPIVARGWGNHRLAEAVAEKALDWGADAIIVDKGRGEGVLDFLRQMNLSPMGVDVGAAPFKPHYGNKRVEMWDDGIKPWLQQGGVLPEGVQGLVEDLCGPCFRPDSQTGKTYMETADQMRKRGLPSPDLGMALAFTFAYPIQAKAKPLSQVERLLRRRTRSAIVERDSWEDQA